VGQAPGFFGKVRSHGDFVGRRVPPEVRDRFDRWLQAALVRSKQDLGDAWLPVWLSSPLWRFVVAAGVCGEQAWAGVMMPSHDRVGRCFPLLLMAGIDGTPSMRGCLTVHDGWFGQLEELALSTLDDGFAIDTLDAGLSSLEGAPSGLYPLDDRAPSLPLALEVAALACDAPAAPMDAASDGGGGWWTTGSALVAPCMLACGGLPAPDGFPSLLDGRWTERGWQYAMPGHARDR
jgi:type VI secretion system protein ImpM